MIKLTAKDSATLLIPIALLSLLSIVVILQVLKLLSTDQLSFLHVRRHLRHLEFVLEAELPLEVLEVAVEDPLSIVVQAAEDLGRLLSLLISRHRSNFIPVDPCSEQELVIQLNFYAIYQS